LVVVITALLVFSALLGGAYFLLPDEELIETAEANEDPTFYTLNITTVDLYGPDATNTVTLNPSGGVYTQGTVVTLTPVPQNWTWPFLNWSGDLSGSANPTTITMDEDKSVTATFGKIYGLTTAAQGSGTVTPATGLYFGNANVSAVATPNAGWVFSHWTGDLSGSDPTQTVAMNNAPRSITGHFYPKVQFSATSSSVSEGNVTHNVPVTLTGAMSSTVTVNYAVTAGSATGGGTDYTLSNGQLSFPSSDTSENIGITIHEDLVDEVNETLTITLSSPGSAFLGSPTVHTVTINDDDAPPTVAFTLTASSDGENVSARTAEVKLSTASSKTVTVDYSLLGGTAASGTDFTFTPGTLTFLPGGAPQNVSLTVTEDVIDETDETIVLLLDNPSNATVGGNNAYTETIVDNDGPPIASFTVVPASGEPPLNVQFTDTSLPGTAPITSWAWDFDDDGQVDSTVQNPSFEYTVLSLYTISLTVTTVVGSDTITSTVDVFDQTPPVITLNGSATMTVPAGTPYVELEATATDNVDTIPSTSIVIGGDTVDTFVVGTYVVTYNVSDSSGNAATEVTRTVDVPIQTSSDVVGDLADPDNFAPVNYIQHMVAGLHGGMGPFTGFPDPTGTGSFQALQFPKTNIPGLREHHTGLASAAADLAITAEGITAQINPAQNSISLHEKDIAIRTVGDLELVFHRTYVNPYGHHNDYYVNSGAGNARNNTIGEGWTHSFNMHLRPSNLEEWILFVDEHGNATEYVLYDTVTQGLNWFEPADTNVTTASLGTYITHDSATDLYTLYSPGGFKYIFYGSGLDQTWLDSIEDGAGNTIQFTYDSAVPHSAKLTKVETPSDDGRSIEFTYTNDLISQAALMDGVTVLKTVDYTHTAGQLTDVSVNGQTANAVQYAYASPLLPATGTFINTITDRNGNVYTFDFVYYDSGAGWFADYITATYPNGLITQYDRDTSNDKTNVYKEIGGVDFGGVRYRESNQERHLYEFGVNTDGSPLGGVWEYWRYTYSADRDLVGIKTPTSATNNVTMAYNNAGRLTSVKHLDGITNPEWTWTYPTADDLYPTSYTHPEFGTTNFHYLTDTDQLLYIEAPFFDDFEDGDLNGWTLGETWNLVNGMAKNDASTGWPFIKVPNTTADNEVRFDYINHSASTTLSDNYMLAEVRRVDSPNQLRVIFAEDQAYIENLSDATGSMVLTNLVTDASVLSTPDVLYHVRIVSIGDSISVYRAEGEQPETEVLTYTGANLTTLATNFLFLFAAPNAQFSFDNVFVNGDGARITETYGYDLKDQVETVTSHGTTTTYGYDLIGNITSKNVPGIGITTYGYDPLGNVTSVNDPIVGLTSYVYGDLLYPNRITQITRPSTVVEGYSYTGNGSLYQRTGHDGEESYTMEYEYDAFNRLVTVYKTNGTSFFGDTISGLPPLLVLQYNALGQLDQVVNISFAVTDFVYDHMGWVTQRNRNYTDDHAFAYDYLGNITSVENVEDPGNPVVISYTKAEDPNDEVQMWISQGEGPRVKRPTVTRAMIYGDERFDTNLSSRYEAINPLEEEESRPLPSVSWTTDAITISEGIDPSTDEGDIEITLTAVLSEPSDEVIEVEHGFYHPPDPLPEGYVKANPNTDFLVTNGTFVFQPGETTKQTTVKVLDDFDVEPDQHFKMFLAPFLQEPTNVISGDRQTVTITIEDDDVSLVDFELSSSNTNEGSFGVLNLRLDQKNSNPINVNVNVVAGGTGGPLDYGSISNPITIPPDTDLFPLTNVIEALNDSIEEQSEFIRLEITTTDPNAAVNPSGNMHHDLYIWNTTPEPTITLKRVNGDPTPSNFTEGQNSSVNFELKLSHPTYKTVSGSVIHAFGTATYAGGEDYGPIPPNLFTIPPSDVTGNITTTFQIPVADDQWKEITEDFTIYIHNDYLTNTTTGSPSGHTVNILNDELSDIDWNHAQFGITESSVSEYGTQSLHISLAIPAVEDTTLNYSFSGIAINGVDYDNGYDPGEGPGPLPLSGQLTIYKGSSSGYIHMGGIPDAIYEDAEVATLTLTSGDYATPFNQVTHDITITNSTPAPMVGFVPPLTTTVSEDLPGGLVTVDLTMETEASAKVKVYVLQDGTAELGEDYDWFKPFAEFPAGDTTTQITIPIRDDWLGEQDEELILTLHGGQQVPIDPDNNVHTITILNDDELIFDPDPEIAPKELRDSAEFVMATFDDFGNLTMAGDGDIHIGDDADLRPTGHYNELAIFDPADGTIFVSNPYTGDIHISQTIHTGITEFSPAVWKLRKSDDEDYILAAMRPDGVLELRGDAIVDGVIDERFQSDFEQGSLSELPSETPATFSVTGSEESGISIAEAGHLIIRQKYPVDANGDPVPGAPLVEDANGNFIAGGATVYNPATNSMEFQSVPGTPMTLEAVPGPFYEFKGWDLGEAGPDYWKLVVIDNRMISEDNPLTIYANSYDGIEAIFVKKFMFDDPNLQINVEDGEEVGDVSGAVPGDLVSITGADAPEDEKFFSMYVTIDGYQSPHAYESPLSIILPNVTSPVGQITVHTEFVDEDDMSHEHEGRHQMHTTGGDGMWVITGKTIDWEMPGDSTVNDRHFPADAGVVKFIPAPGNYLSEISLEIDNEEDTDHTAVVKPFLDFVMEIEGPGGVTTSQDPVRWLPIPIVGVDEENNNEPIIEENWGASIWRWPSTDPDGIEIPFYDYTEYDGEQNDDDPTEVDAEDEQSFKSVFEIVEICEGDSDCDGVPDEEDDCPYDPDDGCVCGPGTYDVDCDGIPDDRDPCIGNDDDCEEAETCGDFPESPDFDCDGIPNAADPCPHDKYNLCVNQDCVGNSELCEEPYHAIFPVAYDDNDLTKLISKGVGGDPVTLVNGELMERAIDMKIPLAGMDFTWSRLYRSKHSKDEDTGYTGVKWDHSYNIWAEVGMLGGKDYFRPKEMLPLKIKVHNGRDGRTEIWKRFDPQMPRDEMFYIHDGIVAKVEILHFTKKYSDPDQRLVMTYPNGEKWTFFLGELFERGRIEKMENRHGVGLEFEYDGNNKLTKIDLGKNRDVEVTYNADGLIDFIADSDGRAVLYDYTDHGLNEYELDSVTRADGSTVNYEYQQHSYGYLDHSLISITDGNGNVYLRNEYDTATGDTKGWVLKQAHGKQANEPDPMLWQTYYDFDYTIQSFQVTEATVTQYIDGAPATKAETEFDDDSRVKAERTFRFHDSTISNAANYNETKYEYVEDLAENHDPDNLLRKLVRPSGFTTVYQYGFDNNLEADFFMERGNLVKATHYTQESDYLNGDPFLYEEEWEFLPGWGNQGTHDEFVTEYTDGLNNVPYTNTYDPDGDLKIITYNDSPDNITEHLKYNRDGNVLFRKIRSGKSTIFYEYFTYDSRGYPRDNINYGKYGSKDTSTTFYDAYGRLQSTRDRNGHQTFFDDYDGRNRLLTKRTPFPGGTTAFTYDDNGNIATITEAFNDEDGASNTNAEKFTQIQYDELNKVVSETIEINNVDTLTTTWLYDGAHRPITKITPTGVKETYAYNDWGKLTTSLVKSGTDQVRTEAAYEYDRRGLLTKNKHKQYDALGSSPGWEKSSSVAYDHLNRVIAQGQQSLLTSDSTAQTTFYDHAGHVYQESATGISAGGSSTLTTVYENDIHGRVTKATSSTAGEADRVSTYVPLGIRGQVEQVTDPMGRVTTYEFDRSLRVTKQIDDKNNVIEYKYDGNGNVIQTKEIASSDFGGSQTFETNTTYDKYDRVASVERDGASTSFEYDSMGNLGKETDANGVVTKYTYDSLGQMLTRERDGKKIEHFYNALGQLTSQEDRDDNPTGHVPNEFGRVEQSDFADGSSETMEYDGFGRVTKYTDAKGTIISYTYDGFDRFTTTNWVDPLDSANNISESYGYGPHGNLVQDGSQSKSYNGFGELKADGGTTFDYNLAGEMTAMHYPGGGPTIHYDRNEIGLVWRIRNGSTPLAYYNYLGNGRYERKALSNGSTDDGAETWYEYDAKGRLEQIELTNSTGTTIQTRNFEWDAAGNRKKRHVQTWRPGVPDDTNEWDKEYTYTYDTLNQMTKSQLVDPLGTGFTQNYNYDDSGNRDDTSIGGSTDYYTLDPNHPNSVHQYRLTPFDTVNRSHDPNGNLVSSGSGSYEYDLKGQLTKFKDTGGMDKRINTYGGFGRLTSAQQWSVDWGALVSETYGYAGAQRISKSSSEGSAIYVYGPGLDELLYIKGSDVGFVPDFKFVHTDDMNNVTALSDANGTISEYYYYDDYGTPAIYNALHVEEADAESAFGNPFFFQGHPYDETAKLYDFRARWYSPDEGRFIQRDPLGLYGDPAHWGNPYTFLNNNPWSYVDPFGLSANMLGGNDVLGELIKRLGDMAHDQYLEFRGFLDGAIAELKGLGYLERLGRFTLDPRELKWKYEQYAGMAQGIMDLYVIFRDNSLQDIYSNIEGSAQEYIANFGPRDRGRLKWEIVSMALPTKVAKFSKLSDLSKMLSRVRKAGKNFPINAKKYAGKKVPLEDLPLNIRNKYPHSVEFSGAGYPDFSRYSIRNVEIELTGKYGKDFTAANKAAGFNKNNPKPKDYTWHHHQNAGYMQLVPRDLHDAIKHTGGMAITR
jgi:RHS repeat-associated protein